MKPSAHLLLLSLGVFGYAAVGGNQTPKKPAINFGRDVKPILSEHCFKCHGPDAATAASGLRLDSFEGATKHLGDGFAVVPGKPSDSLLIKRVSEKDAEMRMPPPDSGVKPLTPAEIDILRTWIAQGAKYAKHWSFVPPVLPAIPKVSDPKWCQNPIDRFVMTKLDEAHLKPEPEADRNTLALRASLTLTGLPPTPSEIDAFLKDAKPGAYERYVDRLLAKPAYGEHQARYWMDAVRYGDTHGLQLDNERGIYPYRDWVIRAFNQDLPFNKFAEWQLAGDLEPKPTTEQLIATGYVRSNLTTNEGGAIEDEFLARNTFDRVDTTSTIFLGLTVGCAKCHDHKYDPIKQADYYGLFAYFNSTADKPLDGNIALPSPVAPAPTPEQQARLDAIAKRLGALLAATKSWDAYMWAHGVGQPLVIKTDWQISPVYDAGNFDEAFDKAAPGEPGQPEPQWKPFKFESGKDFPNLIRRDNAFVYVRGSILVLKAHHRTFRISSDDGIRVWLNGRLVHSHKIGRGLDQGIDKVDVDLPAGESKIVAKLVNGSSVDGLNIRLLSESEQRIQRAFEAAPKIEERSKDPEANFPPLVDINDEKFKREINTCYLEFGPPTALSLEYRALAKETERIRQSIPMTLIAQEMATPRPTFILKRGEYTQPGDRVERHIPAVLGDLPPGFPNNRRGFAAWITSPKNPLVARVFVNRLWQQHFGTGIVKTAEDFGSQGEWPLDQPLLDYLAVRFVQDGWSVKRLNRLIVTSAAFRQSSRITADKIAKDPENRLISRGPRFRLDAEVIRDRALMAGGLLVEQIGGHGFKPYQPDGLWEGASDPASQTHVYVRDRDRSIYRRSLYLFWKRTSPPPVMTTFDAPLRDSCVVRRSQTNTPLQALAVMNEPAFLEASRTMAAHVIVSKKADPDRLRLAYELTLGRQPDATETTLLLHSLARYKKKYETNPSSAAQLLKVGDTPPIQIHPTPHPSRLDDHLLQPNEHQRIRNHALGGKG